jgi:hypothetical protein
MLAACALAFVAIRLLLWALAGPVTPVADDQLEYLGLRDGLLDHGRFLSPFTHLPTAYRDPGWPAFLALVAAIAGRSVASVVLAQVLLQALTGVLLVDLARRVGGVRAATVTAVLFALQLSFATYTLFVYAETLATSTLVAFAWGWTVLEARARTGGAVAAGALAGALALVRASALPLAPAFAAGGSGSGSGKKTRRAPAYLLAGFATALVLVAWCARNVAAVGSFTPNTNAAVNLWIGNSPGTPLVHGYRAMTDSSVWAPLAGLDERARARRALELTAAEVRAHPGRAVFRALARLPDALEPDRIFLGVAKRGQFATRAPGVLIAIGVVIGLTTLMTNVLALSAVLAPPPGAFPRAAAWAFVAAVLVQVLTLAHPRFTQPAWILCLPASALAWIELRVGHRPRIRATAVAAVVLVAIALRQFILR